MGGDATPQEICDLAEKTKKAHENLKVGWYSGRSRIPRSINKVDFDYIKIGPFIKHLGCLTERTTNQRLYKRVSGESFSDITERFWR